MRRVAVASLLASALVATAVVAHAATLTVDAGVLQTTRTAFSFVPPSTVTVNLVVHRYSGGSGNYQSTDDPRPFEIAQGRRYRVVEANGRSLSCPELVNNKPVPSPSGWGGDNPPVPTPPKSVTHTVCARTGDLAISVEVLPATTSSAPAPVAAPSITGGGTGLPSPQMDTTAPGPTPGASAVEGGSELWSSELEELAAQPCYDGGWQSQVDESGLAYGSEQACVDAKVAEYRERMTSTEQER